MYTRSETKKQNLYFKERGSHISTRTTDPSEAKRFIEQYRFETQKPIIRSVSDALDAQKRNFENLRTWTKQKKSIFKQLHLFFGHYPVNEVPQLLIKAYKEERMATPKLRGKGFPKASTVTKELNLLRGAINHCHAEDYIDQGANFHLKKIAEKAPPRQRYFTEEEIKRILGTDICQKLEFFGLLMRLAFGSCARKGALLDLRVERLNFDSNLIDFRNPNLPKKAKPRAVIPFPSAKIKEDLREMCKRSKSGYVFEGNTEYKSPYDGTFFMKSSGRIDGKLDYLTREAYKQAKVNEDENREKACFHTIRHSGAVLMAKNAVPMKEISVYLGHTTVAETEKTYAKFHPDFMKKSSEVLANLID